VSSREKVISPRSEPASESESNKFAIATVCFFFQPVHEQRTFAHRAGRKVAPATRIAINFILFNNFRVHSRACPRVKVFEIALNDADRSRFNDVTLNEIYPSAPSYLVRTRCRSELAISTFLSLSLFLSLCPAGVDLKLLVANTNCNGVFYNTSSRCDLRTTGWRNRLSQNS